LIISIFPLAAGVDLLRSFSIKFFIFSKLGGVEFGKIIGSLRILSYISVGSFDSSPKGRFPKAIWKAMIPKLQKSQL